MHGQPASAARGAAAVRGRCQCDRPAPHSRYGAAAGAADRGPPAGHGRGRAVRQPQRRNRQADQADSSPWPLPRSAGCEAESGRPIRWLGRLHHAPSISSQQGRGADQGTPKPVAERPGGRGIASSLPFCPFLLLDHGCHADGRGHRLIPSLPFCPPPGPSLAGLIAPPTIRAWQKCGGLRRGATGPAGCGTTQRRARPHARATARAAGSKT